ncbi:MAG: DNA translocase FtsK 4TM domain-containing protein, partial [Betaproteobacteria bacterium]
MSMPMTATKERDRAPVAEPASATARPPRAAWLFLTAVLWVLAVLALATHHPGDPGFTTSGAHDRALNALGRAGAWSSDLAPFLLGYSVWWVPLIVARYWLSLLAWRLRGSRGQHADGGAAAAYVLAHQALGWRVAGVLMLLTASAALEWTRLFQAEPAMPGHAGGLLGYALGPWSMKWLGFNGSGVFWIATLVLGVSSAFGFSWLRLAEQIGAWLEGLREQRQAQREHAEDVRLGEQALRERTEVVEVERRLEEEEHVPIVIEPTVVDVPVSTRVAKERQKPLFQELHDTKLPQVDLLDSAPSRQETVSADTLEMTSRLIEKKLRDFGVEVQVVAASPGPVITRYEIEPATGVKGSQVVNLAKDLARSLSLVSIRVVETIPGKTTMALELPNAKRQVIKLTEILGSQVYADAGSHLTMGLGKDIVGQPVVADLAKMPHCLVAGTTGSGKSVGINAMILSLLYKAEARD